MASTVMKLIFSPYFNCMLRMDGAISLQLSHQSAKNSIAVGFPLQSAVLHCKYYDNDTRILERYIWAKDILTERGTESLSIALSSETPDSCPSKVWKIARTTPKINELNPIYHGFILALNCCIIFCPSFSRLNIVVSFNCCLAYKPCLFVTKGLYRLRKAGMHIVHVTSNNSESFFICGLVSISYINLRKS